MQQFSWYFLQASHKNSSWHRRIYVAILWFEILNSISHERQNHEKSILFGSKWAKKTQNNQEMRIFLHVIDATKLHFFRIPYQGLLSKRYMGKYIKTILMIFLATCTYQKLFMALSNISRNSFYWDSQRYFTCRKNSWKIWFFGSKWAKKHKKSWNEDFPAYNRGYKIALFWNSL